MQDRAGCERSLRAPQMLPPGWVEPRPERAAGGRLAPRPRGRGGGLTSVSRKVSARSQRHPVRCHDRRTKNESGCAAERPRRSHGGGPQATRRRRRSHGRGAREQGYTMLRCVHLRRGRARAPGVMGQDLLKAQAKWDNSDGSVGTPKVAESAVGGGSRPDVSARSSRVRVPFHPRTRTPIGWSNAPRLQGPGRIARRVPTASGKRRSGVGKRRRRAGTRRAAGRKDLSLKQLHGKRHAGWRDQRDAASGGAGLRARFRGRDWRIPPRDGTECPRTRPGVPTEFPALRCVPRLLPWNACAEHPGDGGNFFSGNRL